MRDARVTDAEVLRARAAELAIETFYWDNEGRRHEANLEALERVVDVVDDDYSRSAGRRTHAIVLGSPERIYAAGCRDAQLELADGTTAELAVADDHVVFPEPLPIGSHRLALAGGGFEESTTIVVAPERMPRASGLDGGAALFAPAYALWERAAPLPSFAHLAAWCRALPAFGVDALVTLPLYASFLEPAAAGGPVWRGDPSPYAPVSRLHWNEAYLSDDGLPPAAVPAPLAHDGVELVDWPAVARRRRRQLLDAAARLDDYPALAARVAQWAAQHPDVAAYARFRASVTPDPTDAGYPTATVEASHRLAQLLAHEQLGAIEGPGTAAFALDLPIGSHPDGYEAWAHPDLWAPGMSVGAPPDALFSEGQDWGFAPQLPGEAERTGFALWRQLVGQCGRYASVLRIDHFLGVHRLWWVPDGMSARDGVYVRYPRRTLVSVIAAEATRSRTTVVGEDLGTVPQEIIDTLDEWDMLGLYAEQLLLPAGTGSESLAPIPARTVAGLRTHDMPAFADLYRRHDAKSLESYRTQLSAELGREVPDDGAAVLDAALERLARSAAYLVFADADDLLGETRPHNVPGNVLPGIWRRRFAQPASATLAGARVQHGLSILTQRGRRGRGTQ